MESMFRDLKSNEIDCRIAQIKKSWLSLLLYKDARVDMNILDEKFGAFGWDRDHKELKGNIYAGVGIWSEGLKKMVWKWDAGKESFNEGEKGEASDSFKRACVNWGIGRELYTAPQIFIPITDNEGQPNFEIEEDKGKIKTKTKFYVEAIQIENKEIIAISIKNNKGKRVFVWKRG